MSSEEKVKELEERIEKLEKAENKRVIKKRIELAWGLIKLIVLIVLVFMAWNHIKPYKEKIDAASEKVDKVEKFVNDKLGGFKNYFK